ncbi:MAG: hydroxymethylpyrimidine/phosphomethylpyrimidine kinase [Euryarchaeota archaeon]|nr:hydroxymethylpyrimidine/phosphomethylpyrimidine kinase [Euryarchaeota archaeon]MBU4033097.1 hydroxymethylpyrimidine/phosphomethylpyrimidine kinase [Candidatus Thermoplasmatota archaeon]MBU4072419.1 hydroxymethylpyrimidine/phosphomethylpyrimidine kinase [Candidatus Thermoplasmatota archaeon]MBU4143989.1 hydroxymethylpyrimidine/phosphomethylpyrimidine kinase [Candidatus Thermoplasmatota archaeon]
MPSVLCLSGLDPSGHSGISADMRALNFLGVRCFPVITVLTVQNEKSFSEMQPVPTEMLQKQLDAILETATPDAVKIGALGSSDIAALVAGFFEDRGIPIVLDPVFVSSTGFNLVDDEMIEIYKHDLFPLARILTPNVQEAERIAGIQVKNIDHGRLACQMIYDLGPKYVLLKGGHLEKNRGTDLFYDGNDFTVLESEEIDVKARGTGCAFSSLIAGCISFGLGPLEAAKRAKTDMARVLTLSARNNSAVLQFQEPPKIKKGGW